MVQALFRISVADQSLCIRYNSTHSNSDELDEMALDDDLRQLNYYNITPGCEIVLRSIH